MLSTRELGAVMKAVAEVVAGYVRAALAPVAERLAAVEARAPERGEKGEPGLDGAPGKDGAAGLNGKDGSNGNDGKDGADGKRGLDGKDGADGLHGKDGQAGTDGPKGDPGKDGERGLPGIDGKDGAGIAGKDGTDGVDGRDGQDGRDALQIEVVDLDATRAYPRATWATWRGGLMRSLRTTEPMGECMEPEKRGWQVVMNGTASYEVETVDERTFVFRARPTAGMASELRVVLPVVIDRGVYRAGEAYTRGDGVTWAGSFWIAQAPTGEKPGEGETAWRLAVKAGRHGKDGKDGARGEQGIQGKAGRDLTQMTLDGRKF